MLSTSFLRNGRCAGILFTAMLASAMARGQSGPNNVRASVLAGSDYVRYGLSQNEDAPAVRFAIDFEHKSGLFVGGSLANVEYAAESRFRTPRDTELNVWAGYLWRRDQWMTNITVARYTYPDIERNYDYTEASVNVSWRDRYFLSIARGDDYLAILDRSTRIRTGVALPWIWNLELGMNIGRARIDGFRDTRYTYWDAGLSRPLGRLTFDLRFHDNTYGRSSLLGNDAGDQWVFSMTWALLPRD